MPCRFSQQRSDITPFYRGGSRHSERVNDSPKPRSSGHLRYSPGLRGCMSVPLIPGSSVSHTAAVSKGRARSDLSVHTAAPCISSLTTVALDLAFLFALLSLLLLPQCTVQITSGAFSVSPGPVLVPSRMLSPVVRGVTEPADGGLHAVGSGVWGRSAWGPRGRGRHSPRGL